MKLPDGWYDGEIVVHDENGKPNFNLLQLAFDGSNSARSSTSCSTRPTSRATTCATCGSTRAVRCCRRRWRPSRPTRALFERVRHRPGPAGGGGLPDRAGRRDRQAPRFALRDAPLARLDQAEMRPAPGIRDRRLYRSAGRAHRHRLAAARLLRRRTACCATPATSAAASTAPRCATCAKCSNKARPTTNPFPPRAVPGRGKHWVKPDWWPKSAFGMDAGRPIRHPGVPGPAQGQAGPQSITREQAKHAGGARRQAKRLRPAGQAAGDLQGHPRRTAREASRTATA
jgi:bifunctional non-homologous end joining protein LigD